MKKETELSYCSVAVIGDFEYFQRIGSIYKARMSSVVMPDGYRCGRFECYADRWNELSELITK